MGTSTLSANPVTTAAMVIALTAAAATAPPGIVFADALQLRSGCCCPCFGLGEYAKPGMFWTNKERWIPDIRNVEALDYATKPGNAKTLFLDGTKCQVNNSPLRYPNSIRFPTSVANAWGDHYGARLANLKRLIRQATVEAVRRIQHGGYTRVEIPQYISGDGNLAEPDVGGILPDDRLEMTRLTAEGSEIRMPVGVCQLIGNDPEDDTWKTQPLAHVDVQCALREAITRIHNALTRANRQRLRASRDCGRVCFDDGSRNLQYLPRTERERTDERARVLQDSVIPRVTQRLTATRADILEEMELQAVAAALHASESTYQIEHAHAAAAEAEPEEEEKEDGGEYEEEEKDDGGEYEENFQSNPQEPYAAAVCVQPSAVAGGTAGPPVPDFPLGATCDICQDDLIDPATSDRSTKDSVLLGGREFKRLDDLRHYKHPCRNCADKMICRGCAANHVANTFRRKHIDTLDGCTFGSSREAYSGFQCPFCNLPAGLLQNSGKLVEGSGAGPHRNLWDPTCGQDVHRRVKCCDDVTGAIREADRYRDDHGDYPEDKWINHPRSGCMCQLDIDWSQCDS